MTSLARSCIAALLLLGASVTPLRAQQTFVPIAHDRQPIYRFNFPRNFYASPQGEVSGRKKLDRMMTQLESLKGKVASSPTNLYRALTLSDQVSLELMRHVVYLYLQYATNTKNTTARDAQSKLIADVTSRTSFLQQELMRLDQRNLDRMVAVNPALRKFDFVIESARRLKPHTLSLKEEELLGTVQPLATDWQGQVYQKGLDRTKFGKVKTPQGELDVWTQRSAISNSADREARREGHEKEYAGYASQRDLYAFAMTKLVQSRNELSQLRHYKDNPDETYFNLYLSTPEVKGLFDKLAQSAETMKRYQRLRAARIKQLAGYEDVNVWDLTFVPPDFQRPRFTIDQATATIKETLKPFGPEYESEIAKLLDPTQGRLDIVAGENRVPGAFAWGAPGGQISIFYSFNYEGYYPDVETLIHESGHAVHMELMAKNKVIPSYTSGPSYFTESFAMFNELLLADHMYRHETNPERKTWYLERLLDSATSVYPVTRQAAIEQGMYDGVASGKLKTADDFDAMAKQIGMKYSIWFAKHDELKREWSIVHHYFDQPMYYVNYVFAEMLALKYYQMFQADPKSFVPKYLALVKNGFDAPPSALLKRFLAIDFKDPKLVSQALSVVDAKLADLEKLYGAGRGTN